MCRSRPRAGTGSPARRTTQTTQHSTSSRQTSASAITEALLGYRFHHADEQELQEGIWAVLVEGGFEPRREVRLGPANRIDFMVGRVGIEVKVDGSLSALMRQAMRYVKCEEVDELVIVTTLARHLGMPKTLSGKRITVTHLVGNAF